MTEVVSSSPLSPTGAGAPRVFAIAVRSSLHSQDPHDDSAALGTTNESPTLTNASPVQSPAINRMASDISLQLSVSSEYDSDYEYDDHIKSSSGGGGIGVSAAGSSLRDFSAVAASGGATAKSFDVGLTSPLAAGRNQSIASGLEPEAEDDDECGSVASSQSLPAAGEEPFEYDVFLLHHPSDRDIVDKLRDGLLHQGVSVWAPEFGSGDDDADGERIAMFDAHAVNDSAVVCPVLSLSFESRQACKSTLWYADAKEKPFFPIAVERHFVPSWSGMILSGLPKADLVPVINEDSLSDVWKDAMAEVAARVQRIRSPDGKEENPSVKAAKLRRLSTRLGSFSMTMATSSPIFPMPFGRSSMLNPLASMEPLRPQRISVVVDPAATTTPRWSAEIRGRPDSVQNQTNLSLPLPSGLPLLQSWLKPVLLPSLDSDSSCNDLEVERLASKLHPGTRTWLVDDVKSWLLDASADSPSVLWIRGDPGTGKSVAFAHLIQAFHGETTDDVPLVPVAHVCLRPDRGGSSASTTATSAIHTLAYRLATLSSPLEAALLSARAAALPKSQTSTDVTPAEFADDDDAPTAQRFRRLIADPLTAVLCNEDDEDYDGLPVPLSSSMPPLPPPPILLAIDGVDALPPDALRDFCLAIAGESTRAPFTAATPAVGRRRVRRRVKFLITACKTTPGGRDIEAELRPLLVVPTAGSGSGSPGERPSPSTEDAEKNASAAAGTGASSPTTAAALASQLAKTRSLLKCVDLAGVNQRRDLTLYAGSLVRSVLRDPDVADPDDCDEAARALTAKSSGRFLWMPLAFEPLLHPGVGGEMVLDENGNATIPGPRPPITFKNISELLSAIETFPEGLSAICLGLLSYSFPFSAPPAEPVTTSKGAPPPTQSAAGLYQDALLRRLLGLLANVREPVTISVLSDLLEEVPERDIRRTLYRASCFLQIFPSPAPVTSSSFPTTIPTTSSKLTAATPAPVADSIAVQLSHPEAFADVLANCTDKRFKIDVFRSEADLAMRCVGQLVRRLRPNPLNMEDPAAWLNTEVPELDYRVAARVPEVLRYAARNFSVHLARVGGVEFVQAEDSPETGKLDGAASRALQDVTGLFCSEKLLEWLELLSLMGLLDSVALPSLRATQKYVQAIRPMSTWKSVCRSRSSACFKQQRQPLESRSPTLLRQSSSSATPSVSLRLSATRSRGPAFHVYISALPFSPSATALHRANVSRVMRAAAVAASSTSSGTATTAFRRVPEVVRSGTARQTWPASLWTFRGASRSVTAVSITPDGRHVVAGGHDGGVRVYDADTGSLVRFLEGQPGEEVWQVSSSPDGRWVIGGSADETVRTWDARAGRCVRTVRARTWSVNALVVMPEGGQVVSASSAERAVLVKDSKTGNATKAVSFASRSRPVAECIVSGGEDKTIRLWDARTGRGIRTLEGHHNTVNAVAVSADGMWIVSGSKDTTVRVWDVQSGRCVVVLEGHTLSVNCVAIAADGRRIVSGSDDRTVKVWEVDLEERLEQVLGGVKTEAHEGHGDAVRAVVVSEDGRFVASAGSDSTVKVWSAETGRLVRTVEARALNVGSWEEAARRVATAEMNGQSDGGVLLPGSAGAIPGAPGGSSSNGVGAASPAVAAQAVDRAAVKTTVVSVNGVPKDRRLVLTVVNGKVGDDDAAGRRGVPARRRHHHGSSTMVNMFSNGGIISAWNAGWWLADDGWVWDKKEGGSRRFWVPPQQRGILTSFQGRIVALGTPSGQVVILHV
ncbi:hypothetical protein DFJ73DRAFT_762802 [Zopfochytrium polystomum]|nr:hypothetical protein DFJ73DRAFT_762802 [Zopfochytrium polystomum]